MSRQYSTSIIRDITGIRRARKGRRSRECSDAAETAERGHYGAMESKRDMNMGVLFMEHQ